MENIKDKKCFYTPLARSLNTIFEATTISKAKESLSLLATQIEVFMISEIILEQDYKFIKKSIKGSWLSFKKLYSCQALSTSMKESISNEIKNVDKLLKELFAYCDEKYLRRLHRKTTNENLI